jgi:hypothetical protein
VRDNLAYLRWAHRDRVELREHAQMARLVVDDQAEPELRGLDQHGYPGNAAARETQVWSDLRAPEREMHPVLRVGRLMRHIAASAAERPSKRGPHLRYQVRKGGAARQDHRHLHHVSQEADNVLHFGSLPAGHRRSQRDPLQVEAHAPGQCPRGSAHDERGRPQAPGAPLDRRSQEWVRVVPHPVPDRLPPGSYLP